MRRIIKSGMRLLGVMALILTGALSLARHNSPVISPLLILQTEYDQTVHLHFHRLAFNAPGLKTPRPITDYGAIQYIGTVGDWNYLWSFEDYVTAEGRSHARGSVFRLRGDGSGRQTIATEVLVDFIVFTSDGHWMIYPQVEPIADGWRVDLWCVRRDGTHQQNLTAGFAGYIEVLVKVNPLQLMYDEQWVVFMAMVDDVEDIYRVPLAGGPIENLTAEFPKEGLALLPINEEWATAATHRQYYQLNLQSGELTPHFTALDEAILDRPYFVFASARGALMVLKNNSAWYGLKFGQPSAVWQVDATTLSIRAVSGEQWLLLFKSNQQQGEMTVEKMRVDGTDRRILLNTIPVFPTLMGHDGKWLYYTEINPLQSRYPALKRVRIADGYQETLQQLSTHNVWLLGWSPDGKVLALGLDEELTLLDGDGKLHPPLARLGEDEEFLGWGAPIDRTWQPIFMLGAGGILMISATRPFRRFKKWRAKIN